MYLLCGLGNPGKNYDLTRHNIGFYVLDEINSEYNLSKYKKDKTKEVFKGEIKKINCFLLKPLNYMNLSGIPIKDFTNYYNINSEDVIVIHDDLDLKLGRIKIKKGGGNGGHKGLVSIDKHIGKNYNRIRIGIGHPGSKDLVNKYVLKKFNKEEKKIIDKLVISIIKNISYLLKNKIDIFLNRVSEEIRKSKE